MDTSLGRVTFTGAPGILIKLSDYRFDGNHPNGINVNYIKRANVYSKLEVGYSFCIGSLTSSQVTGVVRAVKHGLGTFAIFRTKNSLYSIAQGPTMEAAEILSFLESIDSANQWDLFHSISEDELITAIEAINCYNIKRSPLSGDAYLIEFKYMGRLYAIVGDAITGRATITKED